MFILLTFQLFELRNWISITLLLSTCVVLTSILVFSVWSRLNKDSDAVNASPATVTSGDTSSSQVESCASLFRTSRFIEVTLSVIATILVSFSNILSIAFLTCPPSDPTSDHSYFTQNFTISFTDNSNQDDCEMMRKHYYQLSPFLILFTISILIYSKFLLKLFLMILYLIEFIVSLALSDLTQFYHHKVNLSEIHFLVLLAVILLMLDVLDRQVEYTSRSDFVWRAKLKVQQEEVETMGGINKILLENILPAHVAHHFLNLSSKCRELYAEKYNSVAVMFASIPNYMEFYNENDTNKQGLECLRLLNEIICDFDKLLLKPKYSCIEKIKTIGSSYMAAAGLQPGQESCQEITREHHNVSTLVEFAIALMAILEQINRESFQRFQLRVGLNHGPVIAGVVGTQKPQYDIWGNTVNVASRMDSCGIMGKIQVIHVHLMH